MRNGVSRQSVKMKFDRNIDEINGQIASEGIGHHRMGGYGDVSRELEKFCGLKRIRLIKLQNGNRRVVNIGVCARSSCLFY